MSHGHTRTHKIHHGLDLGEAITFPLILFFVIGHMGCIQMSFCLGIPKLEVPKFLKLGLLAFSKNMSHTTYTHLFQGNSQLLVGGSQINTLTPNPSFGHNLCFKYSSGLCEPILDI